MVSEKHIEVHIMTHCILVTGGAGSIRSTVIRHLIININSAVSNFDKGDDYWVGRLEEQQA